MDDLIERIKSFNNGRNTKKLNLKYAAMAKNVYRFFRGTAHIHWQDFASAGLMVLSPLIWCCGDLHLENFGSFRGDNGLVYFDLNDFDDAILMPAHWELSRMLTSIFVAFDSLGIEKLQAEKLSQMFIKTYRQTLAAGKALYIERQTADGIVCGFLKQAETHTYQDLIDKKTHKTQPAMKILIDEKRHFALDKHSRLKLIGHMQAWLQEDEHTPYNYEIIDAAFRVAGTGSLGLDRYVLLLKSSNKNGSKYLLLDMKEAAASAAQPHQDTPQPAFRSTAERVITVQQWMQNVAPALLSEVFFEGKNFIVEELQPERDSINFKLLRKRYKDMCRVIIDMAKLTAAAQIRSASRSGAAGIDELIAFAKDDAWQKPLLEYSRNYAGQTEAYYRQFYASRHD